MPFKKPGGAEVAVSTPPGRRYVMASNMSNITLKHEDVKLHLHIGIS